MIETSKPKNHKSSAWRRWLVDAVLYVSDLFSIADTYKATYGKWPNLLTPTTFNEKLQRNKLLRRSRRHIQWADKLAVREYVEQMIGKDYLANLYWAGLSLDTVNCNTLPSRFAIKCNNGSGYNILVHDKKKINWNKICEQTSLWLKEDYSRIYQEWQYRWIKPKVLIEELLVDPAADELLDFKIFCFSGKPEMIQVDVDRFTNHTRAFFDRHFNRLPFTLVYPSPTAEIPKPNNLELMLHLATVLAGAESFVRVDFYNIQERVVFGEMTLHPEGGFGRFYPPEYDNIVGDLMS
ncbi:MAG: ATP-grasp fold amidoligase family protein [Candidatus Binatia bacterium]